MQGVNAATIHTPALIQQLQQLQWQSTQGIYNLERWIIHLIRSSAGWMTYLHRGDLAPRPYVWKPFCSLFVPKWGNKPAQALWSPIRALHWFDDRTLMMFPFFFFAFPASNFFLLNDSMWHLLFIFQPPVSAGSTMNAEIFPWQESPSYLELERLISSHLDSKPELWSHWLTLLFIVHLMQKIKSTLCTYALPQPWSMPGALRIGYGRY